MPTTLRHLSGASVTLIDPVSGAETTLAPGSSISLTSAKHARSLGANVMMTRP
jgi:hypothetical protein